MKRPLGTLCVLVAVALLAACASTAMATSLAINDPSFENIVVPATPAPVYYGAGLPAAPTNGYWAPVVDPTDITQVFAYVSGSNNWVQPIVSGGPGNALAWQPDSTAFAPGSIPDGVNVLATDGWESGVVQNLSIANGILGTVQPGATYAVTVSLGVPLGMSFSGASIGFFDLSTQAPFYVEYDNPSQVGDGNWAGTPGTFYDTTVTETEADLVANQGFNDNDVIGVLVDISADGTGPGTAGTVADNVRVDVSGVAIPEPSSLALLAAGTLSLLAYAWRKRK